MTPIFWRAGVVAEAVFVADAAVRAVDHHLRILSLRDIASRICGCGLRRVVRGVAGVSGTFNGPARAAGNYVLIWHGGNELTERERAGRKRIGSEMAAVAGEER